MGGGFASSVLDRANARESTAMIEKMVAIAANALEARRRETAGGGGRTTRECECETQISIAAYLPIEHNYALRENNYL